MRLLDKEVGFLDLAMRPLRDKRVRTDEDEDEDAGEEDAVVARACLGT